MADIALHMNFVNAFVAKNKAGNNNNKLKSAKISCRFYTRDRLEMHGSKKEGNNLYEVLSLKYSKNVGFEEIKKAYRSMALQYHPDVASPNDPSAKEESTRRFIELRMAYETLSNPDSREIYDYELSLDSDRSLRFGVEGSITTSRTVCSKEIWESQLRGLKRRSQNRMKRRKHQ